MAGLEQWVSSTIYGRVGEYELSIYGRVGEYELDDIWQGWRV